MGLFDIFSAQPAQNAAKAQIAGLNQGYDNATSALNTGLAGATDQYGKAVGTFAPLTGTANAGFNMYGNALGVNGQPGMDAARNAFQASPGYQFQLNQGLQALDRGAASRGMLSSGNTLNAEQQYGSGLANQNYNSWLGSLGNYNTVAPGIAGQQSGLFGQLGNLNYGTGVQGAQYGWAQGAGTGQANANAALAPYNASANAWGALLGGAKLGAQILGGGGFGGSTMTAFNPATGGIG